MKARELYQSRRLNPPRPLNPLIIEASTVGIAPPHEKLAEARIEQERRSVIHNHIDVIDLQIDRLVYDLYGLTDKEVRIVEESTS